GLGRFCLYRRGMRWRDKRIRHWHKNCPQPIRVHGIYLNASWILQRIVRSLRFRLRTEVSQAKRPISQAQVGALAFGGLSQQSGREQPPAGALSAMTVCPYAPARLKKSVRT